MLRPATHSFTTKLAYTDEDEDLLGADEDEEDAMKKDSMLRMSRTCPEDDDDEPPETTSAMLGSMHRPSRTIILRVCTSVMKDDTVSANVLCMFTMSEFSCLLAREPANTLLAEPAEEDGSIF